MTEHRYKLDYEDVDEFIATIGTGKFKTGTRITVKVADGTEYVFTYIDSRGDRINGISAVRRGTGVEIDLETMTLIEHPDE